MREGSNVTLISFGKMVGFCLKAAEELEREGVSCEVINLRSLKPLDRDTIAKSVKKTHNAICVEEGWPQHGVGAEIISMITEDCFDDLDSPPERITGVEVPMPYSVDLELAALPTVDDIIISVKGIVGK